MIKQCLVKPKRIINGVGNRPFDREKTLLLTGREILICLECGTVDEILKDGKYRRLTKSNYAIIDDSTVIITSRDTGMVPSISVETTVKPTEKVAETKVEEATVTEEVVETKVEEADTEEETVTETEETMEADNEEESATDTEEVAQEEVSEETEKKESVETKSNSNKSGNYNKYNNKQRNR